MIARSSQKSKIALMVLVVSVALVASGSGASRAAAAGDYELLPCYFQNLVNKTYGQWSAISGDGSAQWKLDVRCPSEVEFQLASSDSVGANWRGFDFPADNSPGNTIKSVSFDLVGGNGSDGNLEQALAVCSPTLCSSPIKLSGSNVTVPQHYSLAAVNLPPGANHVRLQGRCVGPSECTPARSLKLRNLDFIFADSIAPSIEASDLPLDPDLPALVPYVSGETNFWHSLNAAPFVRYDVKAADAESGVQWVKFEFFRLDTTPPTIVGWSWEEDKSCGVPLQYKIGALCPKELRKEMRIQPLGAINNFGIREGINRMTARAWDAAGNYSSPITEDFLVDSIAPGLRVTSPAGSGIAWQAGDVASIAWENTGEVSETNYDSGLAGARWEVRDASTGEKAAGFAGEQRGELSSLDAVALPGDGVWKVNISTFDVAGNRSDKLAPRAVTIGVDSTVLDQPKIDALPAKSSADVTAGISVAWQPPANAASAPSGICGYAIAVDQSLDTDPGLDFAADGNATSAKLARPLVDGTNYVHLRAVSCAGVGGKVAHLPFVVDTTPPLLTISSPGPAGWYSDAYPLSASIAAGGGEGASMSVALDNGAHVFHSVSTLMAPTVEGTHTFTAIAKDSVGNQSTLVAEVQIDVAPPTVEIAPFDPKRPTWVHVAAGDTASGVTVAQLQYRVTGSTDWQDIGQVGHPTTGVAAKFAFDQRLPDGSMPDGVYELKAVARDNAGRSAESGKVSISLPLRHAPLLTSAFARVVKKKLESRDFALVDLGKRATLKGRLIAATGEPLGGAPVEILESQLGKPATTVGTVETDAAGGFTYGIEPGTSRRIIARFAGDELNSPAESAAKFLVRPKVSLKLQTRRVKGASAVTFKGRVVAPGATPPSAGLPIKIVFQTGTAGKTISISGLAGTDGRFTITRRFKAQRQALQFTVRAVVPWFAGWPYETGRSAPESFVVR